jgi:hypothetical protein
MENTKIKLLLICPHLSTGGMPQFALKRIQSLQKYKDEIEIFLVEYSHFSGTYVVQRNEIIKLLGEDHFFTLGGTGEIERKYELIDIIKNNKIVGQVKVNDELFRHGHPKMRIIDRTTKPVKQRTTQQGREELIEHYMFYHPMK